MGSHYITQGIKITIPVSLSTTNHSWSTYLFQGNPLLNSLLLLSYHTKPYSYDYHSPLDVSLTHWSSRNALALSLSELVSIFLVSLQPHPHKALGINITNISFVLLISPLSSGHPHLKGQSIDHAL
jgi:hypothetical protein